MTVEHLMYPPGMDPRFYFRDLGPTVIDNKRIMMTPPDIAELRDKVKELEDLNKSLQEAYDRMHAQWKSAVSALRAVRNITNGIRAEILDAKPASSEIANLVSVALACGWSLSEDILTPPSGDISEQWAAVWRAVQFDGRIIRVPHWFEERFFAIEHEWMKRDRASSGRADNGRL